MARVTEVKSARAAQRPRHCLICNYEVQVGEPYRYVAKKLGFGGVKLIFCKDHHPRPSHLASGRAAELAEILEVFEDDDKDTLSDAVDALSALADGAQALAEDIDQSADNIDEAFDYSPQAEAMHDTANELTEWADRINEAAEELRRSSEDELGDDWFDAARDIVDEVPELDLTG